MKFEKISYPDGQISALMIDSSDDKINLRINSYEDLFYLRSIADILHHNDKRADLFIPCLFGQRSDRRFSDQNSFDLKLIAETINSCRFYKVAIFDPHSDVALALINNSFKISSFQYVKETIEVIKSDGLVLVSPDAGAYKKVFTYGKDLGLEVVASNKYRDLKGEINLVFTGNVENKDCLIVDDMADGGYTFIVLARKLKEQGAKNVYLYVSHGFFSKGYTELKKDITKIFCTNSVKDISDTYHDGMHLKKLNNFIHQFKII